MNQSLSSNLVVVSSEVSNGADNLITETGQVTAPESRVAARLPADPLQQGSGMADSLLRLSEALSKSYSQHDVRAELPAPDKVDLTTLRRASFRIGKRLFDIQFAAAALLVLAPILLVCAACIYMTSGGSVLFRQRRIGRNNQEFSMVKFRTMIPNAEAVLQKVLESDPRAKEEWERNQKLRNDPRITPLGKFLRRTSIDELPQFWNVLIGEMSVVGPRPIVRSEVRFYRSALEVYSAVRPGVTGLWQVSGRNDTGYSTRIVLDCEYVRSWSAWLDLSIMRRTIKAVVDGVGAY